MTTTYSATSTATLKTVTLTACEWDTIRIAILAAKGQELHEKGATLWYEMANKAYIALKDQTV